MRAEPRRTGYRNQCRFCSVSWTGPKPGTDCGSMDKMHKDARWNEVGRR